MPELLLELQVAARLEQIRRLREVLHRLLATRPLAEMAIHSQCLLLSELASNSVRHAAPCATWLHLRAWQEHQQLIIELSDDGGHFTDFARQLRQAGDITGELRESGMGLPLIAHLAADLEHAANPDGPGNRYRWTVRIGACAARPRLLVIDDDPLQRALLELYLGERFDLSLHADARTALGELRRHAPDLVICDLCMPEMDGLQLREELSRSHSTDLIPFVFISGLDDPPLRARAQQLGFDEFLRKPVNKAQVLTAVERLLQRSRSVRQAVGDRLDTAITASLRPQLPKSLPPWRCALRSRALSTGGGDFVFQRSHDDGGLLLLGDLMGHGEQAKFFSHALQAYLHGLLLGLDEFLPATDLLARLSRALAEDSLLGSTLLTCIVLTWTGAHLQIATAGHPPPLLLRAGRVEPLPVSGMLPGLRPDYAYPCLDCTLHPGERLLLFTDGLSEPHGSQWLASRLAAGSDLELEALADALMEQANALGLKDDASLVLLELG